MHFKCIKYFKWFGSIDFNLFLDKLRDSKLLRSLNIDWLSDCKLLSPLKASGSIVSISFQDKSSVWRFFKLLNTAFRIERMLFHESSMLVKHVKSRKMFHFISSKWFHFKFNSNIDSMHSFISVIWFSFDNSWVDFFLKKDRKWIFDQINQLVFFVLKK